MINVDSAALEHLELVRCPKCRADVPDSDPECQSCGIIFTKFLEREAPQKDLKIF